MQRLLTCLRTAVKRIVKLAGSHRRYTCVSKYAKAQATAKEKLPACVPPTAYANGSALFFYNSTSYRDDLVWGAAWLYKATGEQVRGACSGSLGFSRGFRVSCRQALATALGNQVSRVCQTFTSSCPGGTRGL